MNDRFFLQNNRTKSYFSILKFSSMSSTIRLIKNVKKNENIVIINHVIKCVNIEKSNFNEIENENDNEKRRVKINNDIVM